MTTRRPIGVVDPLEAFRAALEVCRGFKPAEEGPQRPWFGFDPSSPPTSSIARTAIVGARTVMDQAGLEAVIPTTEVTLLEIINERRAAGASDIKRSLATCTCIRLALATWISAFTALVPEDKSHLTSLDQVIELLRKELEATRLLMELLPATSA